MERKWHWAEKFDLFLSWGRRFTPKTPYELRDAIKTSYDNKLLGFLLYGAMNNWDVSLITDMSYVFSGLTNFNWRIHNWDVSNVTNMEGMFENCHRFNQSLKYWDVSKVTNMKYMFFNCYKFNQSLKDWDVSKVTDMTEMFYNCKCLNEVFKELNISNDTNISNMFYCDNNSEKEWYCPNCGNEW